MNISAQALLDFSVPEARQTVAARDAILYALSIGYGSVPLDPAHLRFLYEEKLTPAPTLANVVADAGPWLRQVGVDWSRLVHSEQRLTLHGPLPLGVPLLSRSRVLAVVDRGPEKGMFLSVERTLSVEATAVPLATIVQIVACRGDGGCSSAGIPPKPLPAVPGRAPDALFRMALPETAAILYRLNGDLNPLHIDPAAAAKGGFARPILHGLSSFGHAGYGIERLAGPGLGALQAIAARFSAPTLPGDMLELQIWREGADIRFRCLVPERGVVVIDNGLARIA